MKTRNISKHEYLQALQREYISCEIRSKIYVLKKNKDRFRKLMQGKRDIILHISRTNNITNIIEDEDKYWEMWSEIVPEWGMPNLVYNATGDPNFLYKGTVAVSLDNLLTGICVYCDMKNNLAALRVDNEVIEYPASELQRVSPQKTDEYYYFYPGNNFILKDSYEVEALKSYDLVKQVGHFYDNKTVTHDRMRRIL